MRRGPSRLGLQADLQILVVQFDGLSGNRQRHLGVSRQLLEQTASVGRGERLLDGGHQLAEPGTEPLEVGLHLIRDVLVRLASVLDLLDVQLFAQQRIVRFQPILLIALRPE